MNPLDLPTVSGILNDAAAVLARDNAEAFAEETRRLKASLRSAVERYGLWNVVAILAEIAQDRADESDEGSQREKSFSFAAEILTACSRGVDLAYNEEVSNRAERTKALEETISQLTDVRA